jgi:UDPglucose 6-dehydrogenase
MNNKLSLKKSLMYQEKFKIKKPFAISIVGLGKVGSAMLATYADTGLKVYGVDSNTETLKSLMEGTPLVPEANVGLLLKKNKKNIHLVDSITKAIYNSNFTFVILPTPSGNDDKFINSYLEEACVEIAECLKSKNHFHTICISSTVMPGTMSNFIKPLLEKLSGKIEGVDFGLAYSPEFIALGSVVHNLKNPDISLVGCLSQRTYTEVVKVKSRILKRYNLIKLTFEESEIVKLSINSYITMKISFANMIGELADNTANSSKFNIMTAIGMDSRIGLKFLRPGLGYGGPCFPRDNKALSAFARDLGIDSLLPKAVDSLNFRQVDLTVKQILDLVDSKIGKILFLGITYKENTGSIEESQIVKIGQVLEQKGFAVHFHDHNLTDGDFTKLNVFKRISLEEVIILDFDLIIFCQRDERYKIVYEKLKLKNTKILDVWGALND